MRPDVRWKVEGAWKEPDATWPYRDGVGRLLGYACRWEPADPLQKAAEVAEFLGPGHERLHNMAVAHQKAHPELTYAQAYTHLYMLPENDLLRSKIKAEVKITTLTIDEAQALEPVPAFPRYEPPGDHTHNPVGRIGRLPADYVGG